jgi:hypothetical protein
MLCTGYCSFNWLFLDVPFMFHILNFMELSVCQVYSPFEELCVGAASCQRGFCNTGKGTGGAG